MRKLAVLILILALASSPALAAGKLTVTDEIFMVRSFSDYHYAHVYAELENTGDKPVEYSGGLVEFYDPDGNSIESESPYRMYPNVLAPGEKGFLYVEKGIKEATSKEYIDDYMLTATGKGSSETTVVKYPATARLDVESDRYSTDYYEVATVENDTDAVVYDFRAVFAARDKDGKLLHVQDSVPYYVGILPGSSIEIKARLSEDVVKFCEDRDTPIASIDVIVYTMIDD